MKLPLSLAALLLATTACTSVQQLPPPPAVPAAQPAAAAPATDPAAEEARLNAFLDRAFQEYVALSPEFLTALGRKERYGELDDYTEAADERSLALLRAKLAEMRAEFDPADLTPQGRLSYRLFEDTVQRMEAEVPWRWHGFPITTMGSPMGQIPTFLINQHKIDSVADARAYIARLQAVERVMNEISANVRRQAEMGILPPGFVFEPVRADAERILTGAPFGGAGDSTLLADFHDKVAALDAPPEVKNALIAEANEALGGPFQRGYRTLLGTLAEIEPRATATGGVWRLPQGAEYYTHRLRQSTTTDLSADRIHEIGLAEVERIQGQMQGIKERVGFEGTLQQFFEHIKTDPRFQYPNTAAGREAYLADARAFVDQAMAAAPRFFRRLPKAPLEVRAVEEWREDTAGVAFYNQPSMDGSRPGIYYVNLADMTQVLKPQVEAISYHEGAPGHHFQIALAQELQGIPLFRRFGRYGAYSEGWGLYSERLGQELGFYQDPYSEFGMLSLELWRAVRLVLDTGVHHKRWTREQAIDYFRENSLLSERDIVKEVERYIAWPGQATSYKIGQLKIFELRDRARQALGDRFDIRDFHAVVLENGPVPLDVLEQLVETYIAEKRS